MKIILFGATGMVGQGVLRECLLDPGVEEVLCVGRSSTGVHHDKVREILTPDLSEVSSLEKAASRFDACFFCMGVSSAGMSEPDYHHLTYDYALAAGRALSKGNPGFTFLYVSGAGTDSTGKGRVMWARVKGKIENELASLPFKACLLFRPAFIQPMHGVVSKTRLYRIFYAFLAPLYPVWKMCFPGYVTSTDRVGRAMIAAVRTGAPGGVYENRDINRLVTP